MLERILYELLFDDSSAEIKEEGLLRAFSRMFNVSSNEDIFTFSNHPLLRH